MNDCIIGTGPINILYVGRKLDRAILDVPELAISRYHRSVCHVAIPPLDHNGRRDQMWFPFIRILINFFRLKGVWSIRPTRNTTSSALPPRVY
jgi:hypothetical protein